MQGRTVGLEVVGTAGAEELVKCPFHDDTHASASWNPKSDLFYCFTCGFGMGLEQLLKATGKEIDSDAFMEEREEHVVKLDLSRPGSMSFSDGHYHYNDYLKRRGVSEQACIDYGVTVSGEGDKVFFAVTDTHGRTKGRISRNVHESSTRYIKVGEQTPVWPMDHLVGLTYGEYVLVTEGLFSCLRIASVDKRIEVFALAGARANKSIVSVLSAFNPIFIYDRDKAGIRAARRMKKFKPEWIVLTAGISPDDMMLDSSITKLIDKLLKKILNTSIVL